MSTFSFFIVILAIKHPYYVLEISFDAQQNLKKPRKEPEYYLQPENLLSKETEIMERPHCHVSLFYNFFYSFAFSAVKSDTPPPICLFFSPSHCLSLSVPLSCVHSVLSISLPLMCFGVRYPRVPVCCRHRHPKARSARRLTRPDAVCDIISHFY